MMLKMVIKKISKDDLFGVFKIKKIGKGMRDSYYETIDVLRPLFIDSNFISVISGFYLNLIGNDICNFTRISYFVPQENSDNAISVMKQYFQKNELKEVCEAETPRKICIAKSYGGKKHEEDFRVFLHLYTQIGLDLLKADKSNSRILMATYRWQVWKAALSIRDHFEPAFSKLSQTFNSWTDDEKEYFFSLLIKWPDRSSLDWAHMMVNMVLACDWNEYIVRPGSVTSGKPLAISDINTRVKCLGINIPLDWKPNNF